MSLNSDEDLIFTIISCHKYHEKSALLPVSVAEEVAARLSKSSQKVLDENPMTLEQAQKLKHASRTPSK